MYIFVKAVLIVSLGLLFRRFFRRQKIATIINKMPGPPTLPILGNILLILDSAENVWNIVRKCNRLYGPTFRFWTPHWITANINGPEDIEIVFNDSKMNEKSAVYDSLRPWLREGLLTSSGQKWQERRKILTPAFHFNILHKYMEIILEQCHSMIKELHLEDEPIRNLESWVSDHTLNIICETAMGISLKNINKEMSNKYKSAVHLIGAIITHRTVRPWLVPNILFNLTPWAWKQYHALKILHNFSTKIINERKNYHKQTGGIYLKNIESSSEISNKKRLAMLDLLIAAYEEGQIDDLGIQEEVDTFIFEGYDTTAMAMCYALLLLAEHTEIQARAREEIESVWLSCDGKINITEVQKLTYVDRCIKETLRLYPSVPFLSRKTKHELKLQNYTVPADVVLNIHLYDTHRNPEYWPNPDVYDPDRFLPENVKGRHPFAYVPFSGGFRNCIGQKFAMLELKTTIAFLLYHFKIEAIETTKDVRHKVDLVIRHVNPLHVKLVPIINRKQL